MVRCSMCCECCWTLRWDQENTDTLMGNCSSGDLVQLGGKRIPGFRYWYSEVYFFILKGIKIIPVVLTGTRTSWFFPLSLYVCRKLQPGKSQAVITPSPQGFVSLPLALHSDVSVLTSLQCWPWLWPPRERRGGLREPRWWWGKQQQEMWGILPRHRTFPAACITQSLHL